MVRPRLLVVDDSPEVALILGSIARRAGIDIVSRTDSEQAWAWLQENQPDLLLVDLHLPAASGADLFRWLKQGAGPLGERRDLASPSGRLGLLGQLQRPEDIVLGLHAGADFVFAKDLLGWPDECRRRLEEILAWSAGRPPPALQRWLLTWSTTEPLADCCNRMLRSIAAHHLAPELLQVLVRRALSRTSGSPETGTPALAASWLDPDGIGMDDQLTGANARPALEAFTTTLAEQIWCVLGSAACTSLLEKLAVPVFAK